MAKGKTSFDAAKLKLDPAALERLFKRKAPPLIGADLSSSSIKMVELSEAGKGMYRVERYAIEPLPKDAVIDGNINNLDAVSDALRRCHKRLGTNIKNVALALPNAAVISKRIYVPAGQTEEELEVQVETEANQYKPTVMDVDLYAAQAAFELISAGSEDENKDENIAMVDVGASNM